MSYRDKIVGLPALEAKVAGWRAAGQRVALANGCFDILHVGHVRYLVSARATADRLIVGVNSDASTRRQKGPHRPILNESVRSELVAALSAVDAVVIFDEPTVETLLRRLRPDVHAKGTDYAVTGVPEAAISRELGIRVRIVGDPKDHSTRDLLRRLASGPQNSA